MGASLVLVTTILKVSKAEALEPSTAVTAVIVPTSPFFGVPLKVRVPALKESHEEGLTHLRGCSVCETVPTVDISKCVRGKLKVKSTILSNRLIIYVAFIGASLVLVTTILNVAKAEALEPSVAVTLTVITDISMVFH